MKYGVNSNLNIIKSSNIFEQIGFLYNITIIKKEWSSKYWMKLWLAQSPNFLQSIDRVTSNFSKILHSSMNQKLTFR